MTLVVHRCPAQPSQTMVDLYDHLFHDIGYVDNQISDRQHSRRRQQSKYYR
jgi:hypothetical protein